MKLESNFNVYMKVVELQTKIKNSPQPQVRSLTCQSSEIRNFFVSPQLPTFGLPCGFSLRDVNRAAYTAAALVPRIVLSSFAA